MFAYLEGNLTYKSPSLLFVSVNGVGYEVHISLHTFGKIQHKEHCKLYTHLQVREDAWVLYGFADEEEKNAFRQLLGISGVGAATARVVLSFLTPVELAEAVNTANTAALEKVKGIGAKTAQRIILELKGKIGDPKKNPLPALTQHNTLQNDALNALVNLGISKPMAENALKKVNEPSLTVEELIKKALKAL